MLGNDYRLLQHTQSGAYLSTDGAMFTPQPVDSSKESSPCLWDLHPISKKGESLLVKLRQIDSNQRKGSFLKARDIFKPTDLEGERREMDTWLIEKVSPGAEEPFGFTHFLIYAFVNNGEEVKISVRANLFCEESSSSSSHPAKSRSPLHGIPKPSASLSRKLFNTNELLNHWYIRQVAKRAYRISNVWFGTSLKPQLYCQKPTPTSGLDFLSLVWQSKNQERDLYLASFPEAPNSSSSPSLSVLPEAVARHSFHQNEGLLFTQLMELNEIQKRVKKLAGSSRSDRPPSGKNKQKRQRIH